MVRGIALAAGLLAAVPALAGEMNSDEARRFVVGKTFNYTCFEGTRGQGRVLPDGAVVGSIQVRGSGRVRYASLPPGTLRVKAEGVCASLRGLPMQPCFNLERIDGNRFRGSISGLSFAYCEFARHNTPTTVAQSARSTSPLGLRPSFTADNQ